MTAEPPAPGSEAFSVTRLFQNIKRGIHGARESATASSTQAFPIDAEIRQVRFSLPRNGDLTILGTDRADGLIEMKVTARGFDQAEAKSTADDVKVKIEREGMRRDHQCHADQQPVGPRTGFVRRRTSRCRFRGGWQWGRPTGKLTVTNVASGEIGARGEVRIPASPVR